MSFEMRYVHCSNFLLGTFIALYFLGLEKFLSFQVHGMLSQMDPALMAFCEKIAAEGGPMPVPEEFAGSSFPSTTVVHLATVTRVSARLRNVQPEVNLDQSYESLKRPKKNVDAAHTGIIPFGFWNGSLLINLWIFIFSLLLNW